MNKKILYALLLITVMVIILIVNRGDVKVDLVVMSISALKSIVFLSFIAVGVVIGVLLK
jgi:uncharacterized integral membrane protein